MAKKNQIAFEIGFQDYVAMALAFVSFVSVAFFYTLNTSLYILCFALFLSIFLEKRVQTLLIVNSFAYMFLHQFFLKDALDVSAFDFLLLSSSRLTTNSFVAFVGSSFLVLIIFLSEISSVCLLYELESQRLLEYISSLSSVVFVILAFIFSLILAQDINFEGNYQSNFYFLSFSFSTNSCFIIKVYLLFILISNLYYIVFSLIFLSFFTVSKAKNKVTFKKLYSKTQNLKKNVENKQKQKEQEHEKNKIKPQKKIEQKVRGV